MPLTPQDVQNKVFSPTRFKTGYNEDEVDAFLDEVESELTRLLDESADLRRQLDEARRSGGGGGVAAGPPPQLLDENAQLRRQLEEARRQLSQVRSQPPTQAAPPQPVAAPMPAPAPVPVAARGGGPVDSEIEQRVARTLVLAQRTADEALREARTDAERARREARADADRIIGEARAHVAEQLGGLEEDKRRLEGQVEQLRAFEREYRTRLRAYLEMQVRDLDGMPTQSAVGQAPQRAGIGGGSPAPQPPGPGQQPGQATTAFPGGLGQPGGNGGGAAAQTQVRPAEPDRRDPTAAGIQDF